MPGNDWLQYGSFGLLALLVVAFAFRVMPRWIAVHEASMELIVKALTHLESQMLRTWDAQSRANEATVEALSKLTAMVMQQNEAMRHVQGYRPAESSV